MKKNENAFQIIVTINDNNLDKPSLIKFIDKGATFFRLNGAFLGVDKVSHTVGIIRKIVGNNINLLLDLPGYKVRFLYLHKEISFEKNKPFEIKQSCLNYPDVYDILKKGSLIRINDGMDNLEVVDKIDNNLICIADRSGSIRKGKGMHLDNISYRPSTNSLSRVDEKLIDIAKLHGFDYIGLSFVYDINDINYIKAKIKDTKIKVLPKIESKESVTNVLEIIEKTDECIIDRGDLAGEIGLENIWETQRKIISISKILGKKIYIATQLLTSMVNHPLPSIAEIDSLYDLLNKGVDGIQLSEETSIGHYAPRVIEIIKNAVNEFHNGQGLSKNSVQGTVLWMLGPTSTGKTTIANEIVNYLNNKNQKIFHYDGDEIRNMFNSDYGFGKENRMAVVKNLVRLANKTVNLGFNVIVSALTAHEEARSYIYNNIKKLIVVYISTSKETCIKRDPKGLYKKAINGEIDTLIGINNPYNPPEKYEIKIETEKMTVQQAAQEIIYYIIKNNIL